MGRDDWYRRTTWTETDATEFQDRLKRSRGDFHKAQYLRIQAHYLASANLVLPAIELLDQLFENFPDESQLASARLQYAECMLNLDRVSDAVANYRLAFDAEQTFPNSRTQLWLDFPWLIVTRRLIGLYSEIDTFLDWGNRETTFPVDEFRLHTILAFVADESGDTDAATINAKRAIAAAKKKHSGFAYHPTTGLVGTPDSTVLSRLHVLAGI